MRGNQYATDAHVLAMLTAFRETGLATDPDRLNRAWRALTGYPRLGPCARCSSMHQRYGEHGHPLCPDCRTHRPEQEIPT